MPLSPLDNLVRIGQLKTETPTPAEIEGLLRSGNVRLRDAQNASLAIESRLISPTTPLIHCRLPHCAGTAIVRKIVTSCFSVSLIRCNLTRHNGESSIKRIASET